MHASLCLTFNAYEMVEVKWYQSSFWEFIVMVISMIFAVPSGGTSFSWGSLLTLAGLRAAAYALIVMIYRTSHSLFIKSITFNSSMLAVLILI